MSKLAILLEFLKNVTLGLGMLSISSMGLPGLSQPTIKLKERHDLENELSKKYKIPVSALDDFESGVNHHLKVFSSNEKKFHVIQAFRCYQRLENVQLKRKGFISKKVNVDLTEKSASVSFNLYCLCMAVNAEKQAKHYKACYHRALGK